jgi:hypothetical protein
LCRPGEVPGVSKNYNAVIFRITQSILFLLDSEDEGIMIFRNTGNFSHHDTASHSRRLKLHVVFICMIFSVCSKSLGFYLVFFLIKFLLIAYSNNKNRDIYVLRFFI